MFLISVRLVFSSGDQICVPVGSIYAISGNRAFILEIAGKPLATFSFGFN